MIDFLLERMQEGKYGDVVKLATEYIKSYPNENLRDFYELKISSLVTLRHYTEAKMTLKLAVKKYPDYPLFDLFIAEILILTENYEDAECQLKDYIEKYGEDIKVLQHLLHIAETKKGFAQVVELCSKLVMQDENLDYYITCSIARLNLGNSAEAIRNAQKAIDLAKEEDDDMALSWAYNNLGYIYLKTNNYSRAIECFKISIDFYDELAYAYNNLGYAIGDQGNIKEGLRLINKSIELDPENSYAYKNKAKMLIKLGDYGLAVKNLETAKKLHYTRDYDNEVSDLLAKLAT